MALAVVLMPCVPVCRLLSGRAKRREPYRRSRDCDEHCEPAKDEVEASPEDSPSVPAYGASGLHTLAEPDASATASAFAP